MELNNPINNAQAAAIFFFLLLLLHFARSRKPQDHKNNLLSKLPSPPWKLPVMGHMHLVGSLRDLAVHHIWPRPDAPPPRRRADARRLLAEAVLRTHDLAFASRPRSMVTDIILYGAKDSCFAPYGDHFRKVRKVVTVHLLNSKKVLAYRPARQEEVRIVIDKLRKAAMSVVDMTEILHSFANDLICRAVSGKFFREEGRNKMFRELIDTNASLLGGFNLEDFFPGLARKKLINKMLCARAMRVRRRWDKLLDKLIDDHATRLARRQDDDDDDAEHQQDSDFIDILLYHQEEYGFTRDNIKAILVDMFEAGIDTSYLVLESAMVELIRKPHLLAKLQDEVRRAMPKGQDMITEDDLVDMAYLKAVIKETLRLHPPVPLYIPHLSREDCSIDGYMIPAGTRRRMCPGIHSATITLEIMLANLMYCFNWKLPLGMKKEDIDMIEVFGLAVHRKEKLLLVPQVA
uniref:Cytochrome P450 n=1 Tax=Leersia perrieri TaxID=77586 RepID=A0A0D9X3I1_9ORYZ